MCRQLELISVDGRYVPVDGRGSKKCWGTGRHYIDAEAGGPHVNSNGSNDSNGDRARYVVKLDPCCH